MEVYIDDMLIKSLKVENHCRYLKLNFELLEKYHIKLNLTNSRNQGELRSNSRN